MKKNKVFLLFFMFVFLITGVFGPVVKVDSASDISLIINDKKIKSDVSPMIVNNRTLVPVRVLFEHLNADVAWNDSLKQVTVTSPGKIMIFNINSTVAYLNSKSVKLDAAPVIVNNRTLVPVRFISENLGYTVDWNGTTQTVFVYSEKNTQPGKIIKPSVSSPKDDKPSSSDDSSGNETKEYDAQIESIEVDETKSKVKITVTISKKTQPEISKLSDPSRLIFDFKNVYQECDDEKVSPDDAYPVKQVRWARHDDYSRIVVESYEEADYAVKYTSSDTCVISVTKKEKTSGFDEETSDKKSDSVNESEKETENDSAKNDEKNSSGKKEDVKVVIKDTFTPNHGKVSFVDEAPTVVIDAGHGGSDSGAIGRDDEGTPILYEKILTLDISKKVSALLKKDGIDVIMTRAKDIGLGDTVMKDLVKRCDIANEAGADLFVSVHINSFSEPTATGSCVLYAGLSTNTDYGITGKQLAQNIQKNLVKATGLKDRGIVESPNIVVLKRTAMPAALVECAFISCKEDQAILSSEIKLNDIAEAIYSGIIVSLKQTGHIK